MRDKWNRDSAVLQFSKAQLNEFIEPAFPGSSVLECQETTGGLANTNIRLHLNSQTEPILLRIFVRDSKQAGKEWRINSLVHKTVPTPMFFHFGTENEFTGHPYILMEWIEGVRLEEIIGTVEPSALAVLAQSVGSALAAIHRFKFEHFGFFESDLNISEPIDIGSHGLMDYANHCLKDGVAGERLGADLTRKVLDFLQSEAHLLDEWQGAPCLAHSDFGGSNILVNQSSEGWNVAAVLDWEFAFSGTPFFDFGNLLRAPHGTIPGFGDGVAEGYVKAGGELPEKWRQMSLLTDLTAWFDFLMRKDPGANLIADAQRVVSQTIDEWRV